MGWVNGNYQRILFHSVRTASADRVREMAAPRRHLTLVCFLHQAWRDTLDQAVDMYGKLLDRNRKRVEDRLDDMLKAQRHAVDRIVHRYHRLGAVLLDPDVGDAELRARLLSTVPETQLREDQSDLANWTRGDRKARFEADRRAARRAEPVRRAVSDQDEVRRRAGRGRVADAVGVAGLPQTPRRGTPRLAARRTARLRTDGAAAAHPEQRPDRPPPLGKRVVPPGPRRDPQTGNLAIDGAKNFGRFEAFFLPSVQWEQVRDAFWARTGFPVDPAAAVEQLKARLSDAFDRFLEGVPDNRQVVFDDDGWRLKTDPAEHLDPAQSDSLVELHRWLDARSRSIRLADLLIEVENDLGFSVHFQAARRAGRPRGSVRAARRDPRPRPLRRSEVADMRWADGDLVPTPTTPSVTVRRSKKQPGRGRPDSPAPRRRLRDRGQPPCPPRPRRPPTDSVTRRRSPHVDLRPDQRHDGLRPRYRGPRLARRRGARPGARQRNQRRRRAGDAPRRGRRPRLRLRPR